VVVMASAFFSVSFGFFRGGVGNGWEGGYCDYTAFVRIVLGSVCVACVVCDMM
jgi:hypothetical protein